MNGHGSDAYAKAGCRCAACHERRRELAVLAALRDAVRPPRPAKKVA